MRFIPSPNHSERTRPVSIVVLHYTETPTLERAVRILTDPDLPHPVSSHSVGGLAGQIVPLVPEGRRARHAGVSFWRGETDVNSASVGIEIVNAGLGTDAGQPAYPEAQIEAVVGLCRGIMARHAITDVVGHSDVAPTRKVDPGAAFPWRRLAAEGVGRWTDGFASGDAADADLLASIGYDVSDLGAALRAFRLHFYPAAILSGGPRTHGRLVAGERLFRGSP